MTHYHFHKHGFWIRLGRWNESYIGPGSSVVWGGHWLFSERNGYTKCLKIGKLRVKMLGRVDYRSVR